VIVLFTEVNTVRTVQDDVRNRVQTRVVSLQVDDVAVLACVALLGFSTLSAAVAH
jgi:hypothetical protein